MARLLRQKLFPKRLLPCSWCRGAHATQLPSQQEGSAARTAESWLVIIAFVPRPRHKDAGRFEACGGGCRRVLVRRYGQARL